MMLSIEELLELYKQDAKNSNDSWSVNEEIVTCLLKDLYGFLTLVYNANR